MPKSSLALSNIRGFVILLVIAFHSFLAYLGSAPASPAQFNSPPYAWVAYPIVDSARWFGFDLLGYGRPSDSCNIPCSVSVSERSMPWASALIPPCMKQWRKWTILDHRPVRSSASQRRDTPSTTDYCVLLGSS